MGTLREVYEPFALGVLCDRSLRDRQLSCSSVHTRFWLYVHVRTFDDAS